MRVEELRVIVEQYRDGLRRQSGRAVMFSVNGPADMGIIDALVAAVAAMEKRVGAMEKRATSSGPTKTAR